MRSPTRWVAVILMVGGLAACPAGDRDAAARRGDPVYRVDYAPGLQVELDAMTRTASGLYYRDLAEGTGEPAQRGEHVVVHYTGWLPNGQQFDSSRERDEPFDFTLGAGQVITGWDEGVAGMREGGRRQLVIPPDLAYGDRGAGFVIPPRSTLVFDVELLEVRRN